MTPASVLVGSVTYRVTTDPDDWMRIEHKVQSKGDYGHCDNLTATIYVNPDLSPDVARLTLWHEVLHALCEAVIGSSDWRGLGKAKNDREETVIREIESPTLLVLRDNPALVTYLTAR